MIDISIYKVNKNYGFNPVLKNVSLEIKQGDRISLIGDNGSGKSTLLKIIAKEELADNGEISIRTGIKIGYLKQIPDEEENITVKDMLYRSAKDITDIEEKLRDYEQKMLGTDTKKLNEILKKYGNLQEKYMHLGGYEVSEKIGRIVTGFKLESLLEHNFSNLSGGEKRMVLLASIMINQPDVLLLDEPTNHLDIETLSWFEDYINSYPGTVVMVSHDRYFLDKVVTKTVLLEQGNLEVFHGNYSYFLEENEKRIELEFQNYNIQQKQIESMKKSIKKLREWGHLGNNERFFKRAVCMERRLEKMEKLDKPITKQTIPFQLGVDKRSGKDVLIVNDYTLKIGNNILLENSNMEVYYGDKICLIGPNGSGKSTFIKDILSIYNGLISNNIKIGSNIKLGYIPQEIVFDDSNRNVYDIAREYYIGEESHLRATLSKFLFYGKNIFKKVSKLSGGEKVRLKLFELMQKEVNLIIMDEPTNHIDIDTKEVLESALIKYQGTVIFVSHDRYFINKVASKILSIENKKLVSYLGNYDDFIKNAKK